MTTRDTKSIRLSSKTKAALDELRHPGQSYDGLLQELLADLKLLQQRINEAVERAREKADGHR